MKKKTMNFPCGKGEKLVYSQCNILGGKLGIQQTKMINMYAKVQSDICTQEEMNFEMLHKWMANQTPDDNPVAYLQDILVKDLEFSRDDIQATFKREHLLHESSTERILGELQLYHIAEKVDKGLHIPVILRLGLSFTELQIKRQKNGGDPVQSLFEMLCKWQKALAPKTDQIQLMCNILDVSEQRQLAHSIKSNTWGVQKRDGQKKMLCEPPEPNAHEELLRDKDLHIDPTAAVKIELLLEFIVGASEIPSQSDLSDTEMEEKYGHSRRISKVLSNIQKAVGNEPSYKLTGFAVVNSFSLYVRALSDEGLTRLKEDISNGSIASRLEKVLDTNEATEILSQTRLARESIDKPAGHIAHVAESNTWGVQKRDGQKKMLCEPPEPNAHEELLRDDFGISVPPLVEYLRGILREYSDGQIIKELVQNAEDAGADTVKFLYDIQQHGTDTLYKPTLAPYQGPALYSFNNAKFKEVDWNGIQNIARSNKKTNRLKVGRFGIGFNSVYHITDLPSIMSDQTLAFIDPLEEHFFDQRGRVKTGKRFDLGSSSETFSTCQDQFRPYDNIFPGVTGGISTRHYDGTLFRFPLRLTANELSDKTYNDENRMDELLQAFQVDADVVMLFLRSLNNVEVLKRQSGQKEPSLVVRVRREHDQDGNPRERDFSSRLESYCSDVSGSRRPIEMTDCVTYTAETQETSKAHRWIVSHLIAGDSISGELSILAEKQSHLPWAAVAIPISSSEPDHAVDEAENLGRVFCFLPLPPGEESLTGLPVHVHGFFGVKSDRRGIKWPGPDQSDTPAQWNKLLVSELIPIAYVNAIRYAISSHMSHQNVSTDSIYHSWPNHEVVRGNWNILLEPFYNALFKEAVIHSDNKGWMKVADVFFNELTVRKEMEEAILKCFSMSGIAYARVPRICRQAIERFYQPQASTISVSSLCRCLREDRSILTKLNAEEKLLILEFILQEDAGEDLEGLPLLPLDDGSFEVFSSSGRKVYIPTLNFRRQLVPGGYQQFIKTVPKEHSLHQLLSVLGGRYQLKSLTVDAVAELLRATMETWVDDQGTWIQDISLPTWLEEVWSMLYRESSSKLHLFEDIYLVPLFEAGDDGRRLLPLCPRSRVIQRGHQTSEGYLTLPNGLENVLQRMGVTVTNCPDYVLCHPAIRDEYIKMPTPEGVVTCLLLSDVELLIQKFLSLSSFDRDVLVECLTQAKLSPDGKCLLRRLPVFERVAGTGSSARTLVCINECKEYIECSQADIPAPLKLTGLLIDGREKSKSLLQKLEAIHLSKYQVILTVLEEIQGGQLYTISEKQLVLQWIMERWGDISINCKSSIDILRHLKFIPNGDSSLLSPSEILDPRDPLLKTLFESQGLFPVAPFNSAHLIQAFKQLGMRGQNEVTLDEITACVDQIETSQCTTKATALLQFLNNNPGHFQRSLPHGCTMADFMREKRCIPCRKSPPEYYPPDMEWRGGTSFCLATPHKILIETMSSVLISGASKSFISQQEHPFPTALKELGITCNTPVLPDVIAQFRSCVRYTTDRKEEDVTDIIPMLKEIYNSLRESWKRDSEVSSHILHQIPFCVWNGNGFSEPSKMCTGELPFDLAPYMSSIPHVTSAFKDLFEGLGVKTNLDTNPDALVEILHEVKRRCDDSEADGAFLQRQRQLVMLILHHVHAVGKLTEEARRRLLVPSHRAECRLIPVEQSAYVDREWLRQSSENEEMDDGEDFTLIHSDISMDLAIFLHVRPVSRLLLDSEELQGFTQAGQHEPLTMRLWNILKNNYEDTAIVNEMIQNAEDAGAEEVRFLIDLRKNENASKKLFSPEMKSCQGPALWVYNDAVFTDQDFKNILRLGGRTKEKNTEKIGKFGTGFNSVYRITDVPSFVSREYVQFFDPHTTHLGNVLPNKSQPGVRLKLNSMKQLRRFPDQFTPFNGVFGLDFSRGNESFHYPGTLFRLPLRSKEAAQESQICKESYDGEKLISLMRQMWGLSQDLLMFTRNVKKVSVFYLGKHSTHPAEAEELFTIEKKVHRSRVKDDEIVMLTESFRRTMTTKGNDLISRTAECDVTGHLDTFKVICKTSTQAASLAQSPEGKECGLSPEGAVAFPFHRPPIDRRPPFEKKVYCFLPLSVTSRFPVHINGSFAVKEDRRSLHMPVPNGRFIHEKWNHILLADVISRAYVSLLSDSEFIQQLKHTYGSDISAESLWPDTDDVSKNSEFSALFDAFYRAMIHGLDGNLPSLFWKDGKSHQFTNVVFLGEDVQKQKSVSDVVMEVLKDHLRSLEVISLSEKTWKALERAGLLNDVITRTYDFNRFFDEVFLPQISQVPEDMRNQLVLFALSSREGELKGKLKVVDCIPVARGAKLRKPGDLVHPKGEAASLYSESDKVFPLGEKFNSADTLSSLCELGMTRDCLHEHAFLERCQTVHILHSMNQDTARKRCYAVLRYLSESLFKHRWQKEEDLKERLKTIPFLPVLCEGNRDPALPWIETNDSCAYISANNVYSHSKRYLVSSTSNVMDETQEWQLPSDVECFLGLANKYPSVQEVLKQFSNFRTHYDTKNESILDGQLEEICGELYTCIESACKENCSDIIIKELQSQPFFLVGRKFVVGTMIAEEGLDLPPHLFKASRFLKRFPYLQQHAAWKNAFDGKDYRGVLQSIYEKSSGQPLDEEGLEIAVLAADRLAGFVSDDANQQLDAYLPDEHNRMRPVSELCYCDVDWFKCDEFELPRCSKKISFMVAKKLKVKDIRQQMLGSYDMTFPGEAFGQHEKLTTRITRILQSYPSDETILKELLQNADDAGASEIHFVYDPRSHNGNKLLGDCMKAMQGPALCVFNNQSFTDEDIRGIRNLGEGSKADNMGKIGRYGVGFNAVYQLTDCPSFISKGERLCMFDPLRKYVPGATPNKPGRQIRVNDSVRSSYPDVFPCYLEDKLAYGRKDFTVFRFPLRKEASKLSQNAWPAHKIRKLLEDFESAAFESLLFLKNITKISISEITSSGDIEGTRTICAEMSEIEKEKKINFLHEVQKFVSATQSDGNFQPEPAEAIYQMKLKGKGREEEWVICQHVGSEDVAVENAMQKYKLLPVGAVAARLPDRKGEFPGKAFCFLPLPIKTGLPVHVHGYFALDHESRRHLWKGSTTDEQTKWNFHIIQRVIAPAYVRLLLWIQEFFVIKYDWSGLISHEQIGQTLKLLQKYHTYFPKVSDKGPYWKALVDRVYKIVASKALMLFPSVYREHDDHKDFFLKWKTPMESPDESQVGYFNTLPIQMSDHCMLPPSHPRQEKKQKVTEKLKDTLIEITFPLVESPTWIMYSLRDACKQLGDETSQALVLEVSPSNVISFLHGDNPLQKQLPIALSKSRIQEEERLKGLISYCTMVKEPSFKEHLHGLPLLLTGDDKLRRFSYDEQVFHSNFCDLFLSQSHRFLHRSFLDTIPVKANVFCELDVTAVSFLLRDCTPFLECGSDEIKPFSNHLQLEPTWFKRLWLLLASFCTEKKKPLAIARDIRDTLGCWAILPVTQSQHSRSRPHQNQAVKQVAAISLSPTIIMEPTYGFLSIHPVLRSLNVYKVDKSILHEDSYKLIQHLVAHKDEPTDMSKALDVLIYWVDRDPQRFRNLKPEEHETILENFRYCKNSDVLSRLKSLPCFTSIGDDFVSIRGYDKVLVLPSTNMIPKTEQAVWVKTARAVFLQYNSSLERLYEELGLDNTTEIEVYAEYILPAFDLLSENSRLEHLMRVKKLLHLLPSDKSRSPVECRKDTIQKLGLRHLRFITGANGEVKKAADFYDPEKTIFSLMLSKNYFPPDHVQKSLDLAFLREIGLQVHVTKDLFLSFAKQVHKSHPDPSEMREKSCALVFELKQNCTLHDDSTFLQLVSEVDFLVSDEISRKMKSIHPPFMKAGTLMRYSGSTSFEHKQLVWSTNSILPGYASISDKCWTCETVFDGKMGVEQEPELMSVVKHLRNMCNRIQQKDDKKISFPEEFVTVLQTILTFLSSKCVEQSCHEDPCENCSNVRDELKNVPIVFLELKDEHRLVKAEQVCRTMEENLEPFICQLPDKWVPLFKVFYLLGGTVRPSIGQYAFVLQSIYNRGQDATVNPNMITMVDRATRGLYEELIKSDSPLDTAAFGPAHSLYLPSSMGTLKRSDQLLMNDIDHYANRLSRSNLPLVKVFSSHERIAQEAISKLPEKMKPKAVSTEVKEELKIGKECLLNGDQPCEFERRLQILQSREFLNALCSIMRYNGKKVDEDTKNGFTGRLSCLKITCMHQLHSILQMNGEDVEGSETEVPSFINSDNKLFVQHSEEESRMETLLSVAIHVNQVLGNVFEDRNNMSILLSQKSPRTISKVLEKFNIPVEITEGDTSFKLPDPGSTVPEQIYHLIEQDPWTSFHEGDYVAYAQTDEDGEYYIYAVVVKTMGSESLKSFHMIDVGRGSPIEANVLDIHKIHIPKSTSGMELVPSDKVNSGEGEPFFAGHRESSLPTDVEETKQQVTTELEEVWQLPEEQKRKALRRLMLKWHPDKHPEGPKELFDEAFKHLQKEVQRLEKGLSRTSSWSEDLFKSANQRAREDRQRYTHFGGFSTGFGRGGGFSEEGFRSGTRFNTFHQFFSDISRAPDIRNARRWLRQGQEDLRAAQHDLDPHDEPSLEWVAYKCHQSVEKALKASQLAIGGQYSFIHSIFSLANDVSDHFNKSSEFYQNVCKLGYLVDDQRARYPDRCASSEIPHEAFSDKAKAEEMIDLSRSILEEVQTFVQT